MSHRGRGHPKGTRSVERELEITRAATVHCTTTFKRPNSMVENILPDSNLPPFPSLDLCHSIDTWSSSHGMDVEAPPVTKGFQVSDLKIRRQEDCAYEKEIAAYLFNTEVCVNSQCCFCEMIVTFSLLHRRCPGPPTGRSLESLLTCELF